MRESSSFIDLKKLKSMKLNLFALAQSAPEKRGGLEPRASLVPCRGHGREPNGNSVIYWNEFRSGQIGDVTFQEYDDNQYCYIEIGTKCKAGVEAEFSFVQLEKSPFSQECLYDWMHFTYTDRKGRFQETNKVCGCYSSTGNACDLETYQTISQIAPMTQVSKYVMQGSDHRLIFKSDNTQSGGSIQVDWECLPDPTATPQPTTTVADMAHARLTGRPEQSKALKRALTILYSTKNKL